MNPLHYGFDEELLLFLNGVMRLNCPNNFLNLPVINPMLSVEFA